MPETTTVIGICIHVRRKSYRYVWIVLLHYYTRYVNPISILLAAVTQHLADELTAREHDHSKFTIGTSSLGFVGAALGVAGAAGMSTPAGPAIVLAAITTSATSGIFIDGP